MTPASADLSRAASAAKRWPTSRYRNTLLVLGSIAVFFLIAELSLRLYDMAIGRSFFHELKIQPYRVFGPDLYTFEHGDLEIRSRHGQLFPLKKADNTLRIVTFGGSTTENDGSYTKYGIDYPMMLQANLEDQFPNLVFETINVANAAYATPHSLILMALDVLAWQPDIVILSHNINDLTAAYFPNFTPDYSSKFGTGYYVPDASDFLLKSIRLYSFVRSRLEQLGFFRYPIDRVSYGDVPPAEARLAYNRNLRSFVELARSNQIDVVLGSQPLYPSKAVFDEHLKYKSFNKIVKWPLHDEFVNHHHSYNKLMRDVAAETGALFVDNDASLGGQAEYFTDFVHYTRRGVEQIAKNYADAIGRSGLIEARLAHSAVR